MFKSGKVVLMERAKNTNSHLQKLLTPELKIQSEYQSILKSNSNVPNIDWLFDIKQRRKKMISKLMDDFGLYGMKYSSEIGENLKINSSFKEVLEYLIDLESKHISELEKHSGDFFCPPEWQQLISENLLPLAKENKKHLRLIKK